MVKKSIRSKLAHDRNYVIGGLHMAQGACRHALSHKNILSIAELAAIQSIYDKLTTLLNEVRKRKHFIIETFDKEGNRL